METIGGGLLPKAKISPAEYSLLLDKNGNLDYSLIAHMYFLQQKAYSVTKDLFQDQGLIMHNDKADAFRHVYWSANLTKEFGKEFAEKYTLAHETGSNTIREEAFMDLHNNSIGIEIGADWPSNYQDSLQDKIIQENILSAIESGELYIWDGQNIFFSDDVPNKNDPPKGNYK